jgi:hypothetical protein
MTKFQAQQILNNQLYTQAALNYRRDPIGTNDKTYRRADLWIQATHVLTKG